MKPVLQLEPSLYARSSDSRSASPSALSATSRTSTNVSTHFAEQSYHQHSSSEVSSHDSPATRQSSYEGQTNHLWLEDYSEHDQMTAGPSSLLAPHLVARAKGSADTWDMSSSGHTSITASPKSQSSVQQLDESRLTSSPTSCEARANLVPAPPDHSLKSSLRNCNISGRDPSPQGRWPIKPDYGQSRRFSEASTNLPSRAHGPLQGPTNFKIDSRLLSPSGGAAPSRITRPSLARLDILEKIKTLGETTTTARSPGGDIRKSPGSLRLQLDTTVPRRSSTVSAFPSKVQPLLTRSSNPEIRDLSPSTPAVEQSFQSFCRLQARLLPSPSSFGDMCLPPGARGTFAFDANSDTTFTISTILPGFLYLGPNIQTAHDLQELEKLGVKCILNMAYEVDDHLDLASRFYYLKIPMTDSVEAVGVQKSIQQACQFLDQARKDETPTYVHCKAGKSRSVTIVMAYLIHSNHWSLSHSYSYVVERRNGVSPNIGFVAELMKYEEKELNIPKSSGIVG